MTPRIRVLVVEDSPTVRRFLVEAISADPACEVVGEAGDGRLAIELCERLRPAVITLDMMLPGLSGLAVTEHLMARCPTPILIVSASFNRGEIFRTLDALVAGAVDVIEKPRGNEPPGEWERGFLDAVKVVSRIQVITRTRGRLRPPSGGALAMRPRRYRLAAIGASTGGPRALLDALAPLPASFPLPILVVLHTGERFGTTFATWLDSKIALPVSSAEDGEPLGPPGRGRVVVAPPGAHLTLARDRLHLGAEPPRHGLRPSVDVLFESVAREAGAAAIGCLLTGMGRDGAEGLLAIRSAGGMTLAQDEATSIVFGMPREAALRGAVIRVLPVGEVGPALAALAQNGMEAS